MGVFEWKMENGRPTTKQQGIRNPVVCNLNVALLVNKKPIGHISGFQVRKSSRTGNYYIDTPSTETTSAEEKRKAAAEGRKPNKTWFRFGDFLLDSKKKIISEALRREKEGLLVKKYKFKLNS